MTVVASRSERAFVALTDVAVAALSAGTGPAAMRAVGDAFVRALGADHVLYHELDPRGYCLVHGTAPASAWESLPMHGGTTAVLRRLHPAMNLMVERRVDRPFTLTELLSQRQWASSEMVSMMRPVWGRTLKLHVVVPTGRRVVSGWAATRDGTDYSSGDRDVAAAVAPLLEVVTRQYVAARGLAPAPGGPLTERERTVLLLVSEGLTAQAVARRLAISTRTVNKHLERVYRKLDVGDRVSALRVARRVGLVDLLPQPRAAVRPGEEVPLF